MIPIISIIRNFFPEINLESFEVEHDPYLCSDIDYLGWVGERAFGIQMKHVTAKANFGNYSISERMKSNFIDFEQKYKGKVFIVLSLDGEIGNKEILKEIEIEIVKLKKNESTNNLIGTASNQ